MLLFDIDQTVSAAYAACHLLETARCCMCRLISQAPVDLAALQDAAVLLPTSSTIVSPPPPAVQFTSIPVTVLNAMIDYTTTNNTS